METANLVQYWDVNRAPGRGLQPPPAWTQQEGDPVGRPALYPTDPKPCAVCGAVMDRHDGESWHGYAKRQTCGDTCGRALAGRARRIRVPDRGCVVCGEPIVRWEGEDAGPFRQRQTCRAPACVRVLMPGRSLKYPLDLVR